jgi:hypothetical protein
VLTLDRTVIPTFIVAVGIPGFTAVSLLTLGNAALDVFPANSFLSGASSDISPEMVAQIFWVAGIWFSLLLTVSGGVSYREAPLADTSGNGMYVT